MIVFLTIAGLTADAGGPSRSVPALGIALANIGIDVQLVSAEPAPSQSPPMLPRNALMKSQLVSRRSARLPGGANGFARVLRAHGSHRDHVMIHDHGLWLASNHAVRTAARELRRPRIVSPRGMLSAWALGHKGLKKKLAWALYQRRDLMAATALHATSHAEMTDCRRAGYRGPIAVVTNGVELSDVRALERSVPVSPGTATKTVLCLARMHPVKGIPTLIEAWSKLRPVGWRLVLAGQGERQYTAELMQRIKAHNLDESVEMRGAINEGDKWALYRAADVFVLPSHSENFGSVVAEALACRLPVIATRGTPWSELAEHRCGWWIDGDVKTLSDVLSTACSTPTVELQAMGNRGRQLIENRYTWEAAARQMKDVYEWILGSRREKPVHCFLDDEL